MRHSLSLLQKVITANITMNSSVAKMMPVGRRLVSSNRGCWTKTASQSFGSIIAHNTKVLSPTTSTFNYQSGSSFCTSRSPPSLVECLTTEITSELADDEIDHEFLDTKKETEKLFKIVDEAGLGMMPIFSILTFMIRE